MLSQSKTVAVAHRSYLFSINRVSAQGMCFSRQVRCLYRKPETLTLARIHAHTPNCGFMVKVCFRVLAHMGYSSSKLHKSFPRCCFVMPQKRRFCFFPILTSCERAQEVFQGVILFLQKRGLCFQSEQAVRGYECKVPIIRLASFIRCCI